MAEERIYEEFGQYIVPSSWKDKVWDIKEYQKFYENTIKDKKAIENWWEKWANKLFWFKKWDRVLDDSNPPFYKWFVGAETNLSYLCLDWQIDGKENLMMKHSKNPRSLKNLPTMTFISRQTALPML